LTHVTESKGIFSSYMLLLDPMIPLFILLSGIVLKLNTQFRRLLLHTFVRNNKHGC